MKRNTENKVNCLKRSLELGIVAHTFNPSSWEAEAGGSLSARLACSTDGVPGQPRLHSETLPQKPSNISTGSQK